MNEQQWIFLASMPRSGSSWISKLIDSHRDILYFHEPDGAGNLSELPLLTPMAENTELDGILTAKFQQFTQTRNPKVICSLPIFDKNYMSTFQFQSYLASTYFSKVSSKAFGKSLISPRRNTIKNKPKTFLWKSVESCGRIGKISSNLPNCKPIHLIRNPCGHINSTLSGEKRNVFVSSTPIYEDWDLYDKLIEQSQTNNVTLDDIKSLTPEERLAWRWRLINDKAIDETEQLNGIILKYDAVCEHPEDSVKDLFLQLNLHYGESTDKYIKSSTSKTKDAYYSLTKDPHIAANKWREQLLPEQIIRIKKVLEGSRSFALFEQDF